MPDLSVLVKNLEIVLEMIGIHLQRTADIHMESLGKISTNKMVFELDPQHIEKLYLVVMCVLCNHRMHNFECERGACDCKTGIPG